MKLVELALAHWDDIVAVGGLVAGVLWHRGKGAKLDDLWDRLLAVARQKFPALLADPNAHAHAHGVLEDALWSKIEKLGIKKNAALDKLVDELIDHALGELAVKLTDRDLARINRSLTQTVDVLKTVTP